MENKDKKIKEEINNIIDELSYDELVRLKDMIACWNAKYYALDKSFNEFSVGEICYVIREKCKDPKREKIISYPVTEMYNDSESIKKIVYPIYEIYNNIIKGTNSIVDIANKISDYELNFEERLDISKRNMFKFKIQLEQVIIKEELESLKKILEVNPSPSEELVNFIKNSKSKGLVRISRNEFYVSSSGRTISEIFNLPNCVFNYNLFCNTLRKLGLNVYLCNNKKLGYYKTSTYNQFLNCVMTDSFIEVVEMYISDKRFELDRYGYSIYKPLENEKQKVFK